MGSDYWVRTDANGFSAMLGSEVLHDGFECRADAGDWINAYTAAQNEEEDAA